MANHKEIFNDIIFVVFELKSCSLLKDSSSLSVSELLVHCYRSDSIRMANVTNGMCQVNKPDCDCVAKEETNKQNSRKIR